MLANSIQLCYINLYTQRFVARVWNTKKFKSSIFMNETIRFWHLLSFCLNRNYISCRHQFNSFYLLWVKENKSLAMFSVFNIFRRLLLIFLELHFLWTQIRIFLEQLLLLTPLFILPCNKNATICEKKQSPLIREKIHQMLLFKMKYKLLLLKTTIYFLLQGTSSTHKLA